MFLLQNVILRGVAGGCSLLFGAGRDVCPVRAKAGGDEL